MNNCKECKCYICSTPRCYSCSHCMSKNYNLPIIKECENFT